MTNSPSKDHNETKCGCCGSKKTDIINKGGTLVFRWQRDPYRKSRKVCGNCSRRRLSIRSHFRSLKLAYYMKRIKDQDDE